MAEIAPFTGVLRGDKDLSKLPPPDAAEYQRWLTDGTLVRDRTPAIYRHHQSFELHGRTVTRKGFFARVRLAPAGDGVIAPHAPFDPARVVERQSLMRTARAHLAPAFGLYSDPNHCTDDLFESLEGTRPELEGETRDGVTHRLWRLTDEHKQGRLCAILSAERIYLADGHDEYQAMLALRAEADAAASLAYESPLQWGSMFFCNFDDPGLAPLATHRVLFGVPPFERADLLRRAKDFFTVTEGPLAGPGAVRPALAGQAKRGPAFAIVMPEVSQIAYLRLRGDLIKASMPALAVSRALAELDVTHLHALIFEELLGLAPAAQPAHLRYVHDWHDAFAELATPGVQALFLMNPTRLDLLRAVVDEGRHMPEQSTWFHPKVSSGMVIHSLAPDPSTPER